jgi:PAS domain S-box-containing protein
MAGRYDRGVADDDLERRFFDLSVDMLCVLDFSGYFRRLNRAWERTLGFSADELMSRPFIEFVHPDDRAGTLARNSSVRGGSQAILFENRYLCKDGSHRSLLWNSTPDFAHGVIYGVARDVTELKAAERERERLLRELQDAVTEVKTLRGFLPMCSYCKRIRDDEDYWHSVEAYLAEHTNTRFSHGICPACYASIIEPELRDDNDAR